MKDFNDDRFGKLKNPEALVSWERLWRSGELEERMEQVELRATAAGATLKSLPLWTLVGIPSIERKL